MELKEMIKVMTHYLNGGEVEFSDDNFETVMGKANKEDDGKLCWNWDTYDYRIKPEKQKIIIEKWLCSDNKEYFVVIETSDIDAYIYHNKVKLIETYEVEL